MRQTKEITMIKSTVIFIAGVLILVQATSASANTNEEDLGFINMILSFVNNREKCQLPTYSEIDEAQRRFEDLKQKLGPESFAQSLTGDQQLLLQTVLDQWDSFQKYLTSKIVLKAAKKRAFLGKVVKYQEQKFGESVCIKDPDTKILDNQEYERNPLVRYVKQMVNEEGADKGASNQQVDSGRASESKAQEESDNDVELKFKVHTRDEAGNIQSSKQYVGKFNFNSSRPQNRITLHLGTRK